MKDGYSIFDTHTHLGYGVHHGRRITTDELLRGMDSFGVDRSLVIPFPVVEDHRAAHDEIHQAVKAHPDRFTGAACLYPYLPRAEFRDEVKRCVESLVCRAHQRFQQNSQLIMENVFQRSTCRVPDLE